MTNGTNILTLGESSLGVLIYYTILDTDTKTIQQAGKLNYVWNADRDITGENPSINFPQLTQITQQLLLQVSTLIMTLF